MRVLPVRVVLWLLVCLTPALPQPVEYTAAARMLMSAFSKQIMEPLTFRSAFAAGIRNYCSEALRIVPHNSPREAAWLKAEMDSGKINLDRALRAADSLEYSRSTVLHALDDCAKYTSVIIERRPLSSTQEALQWTQLALTFSNAEDIEKHAARLGLKSDVDAFGLLGVVRLEALRIVVALLAEQP